MQKNKRPYALRRSANAVALDDGRVELRVGYRHVGYASYPLTKALALRLARELQKAVRSCS